MAGEGHVFINCPFDSEYHSLLRPLLFTVVVAGFEPRIASERSDSGEARLAKLCDLIKASQAAIHDISRLRATDAGEYYRLNMAFELGLTYGHRVFSREGTSIKLLVLNTDPYDYRTALSDFSGMDIKSHQDRPIKLVQQVRNWFVETLKRRNLPAGTKIWYDFNDFMAAFYDARQAEGFEDEDLQMMPIPELIDFMRKWVART